MKQELGWNPNDMRQWVKQVTGIRRYLSELERIEGDSNREWRYKQYEHYTKTLHYLLDNPPYIPTKIEWKRMVEVLHGWNIRRTGPKPNGEIIRGIYTGVVRERVNKKGRNTDRKRIRGAYRHNES